MQSNNTVETYEKVCNKLLSMLFFYELYNNIVIYIIIYVLTHVFKVLFIIYFLPTEIIQKSQKLT